MAEPATHPATPAGLRRRRTLFVVAGLAALILLIAWQPIRSAIRRARTLNRIEALGGSYDTSAGGPAWVGLNRCPLTADDLETLNHLPTLSRLTLDESRVTDAGLTPLAGLEGLRHLSLQRTAITSDGLASLAGLEQLEELQLDGSYRIDDRAIETLASMTRLTSLGVVDTPLSLAALLRLSIRNPELQIASSHGVLGNRKLALSGTQINDQGLLRVSQLTELEGLELPARISDEGLKHLDALVGLRFLVLAGLSVTDRGLDRLLGRLRRLEELDLSGCRQITDEGLGGLAGQPHLVRLSLDRTAVTASGLGHLAGLPRLEMLSLHECRGVTDDIVEPLLALPGLKQVRLSGTRVTDAIYPGLSRLSGLEGIDLNGTAVSSKMVERLRRQLPNCQVRHQVVSAVRGQRIRTNFVSNASAATSLTYRSPRLSAQMPCGAAANTPVSSPHWLNTLPLLSSTVTR